MAVITFLSFFLLFESMPATIRFMLLDAFVLDILRCFNKKYVNSEERIGDYLNKYICFFIMVNKVELTDDEALIKQYYMCFLDALREILDEVFPAARHQNDNDDLRASLYSYFDNLSIRFADALRITQPHCM
jgi:predicted GTPase